ncbi:cytochrome c oxidase subunit 7B, mitochondrial-like [Glossophaga mutica]
MFPLANNLSHLPVQSIQQIRARQIHQKWTHTATQIGIEWNLYPVGRVTPKEWRDEKSSQLV